MAYLEKKRYQPQFARLDINIWCLAEIMGRQIKWRKQEDGAEGIAECVYRE